MSYSSESTGLKPAMLPEKPNFAHTCNLLTQYLKEKGSFGDLSLGMTGNAETNGTSQVPPTTMNLFPVDNKSGDVCSRTIGAPRNLGSMDLFPQQAGFSTPAPKDEVRKRVDSSATNRNMFEPQTKQMTIFYGGQVIVFNDFPADKAKKIMLLASKSSSKSKSSNLNPFTSSREEVQWNPEQKFLLPRKRFNLLSDPFPAQICRLQEELLCIGSWRREKIGLPLKHRTR